MLLVRLLVKGLFGIVGKRQMQKRKEQIRGEIVGGEGAYALRGHLEAT